MSSQLSQLLNGVCPECGAGSKDVIRYIRKHKEDPITLYKQAIALQPRLQCLLIDVVTCARYDYTKWAWFKAFLQYCTKSDNIDLSFRAKNCLDFYKFDKVKDLEI